MRSSKRGLPMSFRDITSATQRMNITTPLFSCCMSLAENASTESWRLWRGWSLKKSRLAACDILIEITCNHPGAEIVGAPSPLRGASKKNGTNFNYFQQKNFHNFLRFSKLVLFQIAPSVIRWNFNRLRGDLSTAFLNRVFTLAIMVRTTAKLSGCNANLVACGLCHPLPCSVRQLRGRWSTPSNSLSALSPLHDLYNAINGPSWDPHCHRVSNGVWLPLLHFLLIKLSKHILSQL